MTTAAKTRPTINVLGCCDPQCTEQIDVDEVHNQAFLLSAMSDPTRLQIIAMLASVDEPLCVCEIVPQFNLGQPTISHHLRILRDANLVTTEKRGLWVYYSVNRDVLGKAASYLTGLVERQKVAAIAG